MKNEERKKTGWICFIIGLVVILTIGAISLNSKFNPGMFNDENDVLLAEAQTACVYVLQNGDTSVLNKENVLDCGQIVHNDETSGCMILSTDDGVNTATIVFEGLSARQNYENLGVAINMDKTKTNIVNGVVYYYPVDVYYYQIS